MAALSRTQTSVVGPDGIFRKYHICGLLEKRFDTVVRLNGSLVILCCDEVSILRHAYCFWEDVKLSRCIVLCELKKFSYREVSRQRLRNSKSVGLPRRLIK